MPSSRKDRPLVVPIDRNVVGRLVKLAHERNERDLRDGHKRGLRFDEDAARRFLRFARSLRHSKGPLSGKLFEPQPWQEFVFRCLFGWKRADGTRRFRESYMEMAKKNGKTFMMAAAGLYGFAADGEAGAEVYSAATKRDQAKLSWAEAWRMAKSLREESDSFRRFVYIPKKPDFNLNMAIAETGAKFEALGADANTTDGINVHFCINDEVHAHKSSALYDSLRSATVAREQPLFLNITTAGVSNKESFAWKLREYGIKVLEGVIEDDSFFVYIATLDEGDDWKDPKNWIKANPNLGVSVFPDKLIERFKKAMEVPSEQNGFRRFQLNQWVEQETRWMPMDKWEECGKLEVDAEELKGKACWGGLDLASTTDVASLELVFDDNPVKVLSFFWVPAENILKRARRDRVPYDRWRDQGYIQATEGNVIDYRFIKARILELCSRYDVKEIGYDPFNATQLVNELLEEGVPMVEVRQGYSMNAPTKELEKLVLERGLAHGNNPVLNWMASSVTVSMDDKGNIRPNKVKSTEKIDGIVALIMALARMLAGDSGGSVYDEREIVAI